MISNVSSDLSHLTGKPYKAVTCEGNICSTVPAQALEKATGGRVLPGKRAQDIFPTDFLRSPNYELVGSHIKSQYKRSPGFYKAMPIASRAAIGAVGAGAVYGATEKPEAAGAAAGALGASTAASAIANKLSPSTTHAQRALPSLGTIAGTAMTGYPMTTGLAAKRWLTRRVPILAAGGALGYHATKKLMQPEPQAAE